MSWQHSCVLPYLHNETKQLIVNSIFQGKILITQIYFEYITLQIIYREKAAQKLFLNILKCVYCF